MAYHRLLRRPQQGRTFQTATWTLGGLAMLQLFAILWGVLARPLPKSVATGDAGAGGDAGAMRPPDFAPAHPDLVESAGSAPGQFAGSVSDLPEEASGRLDGDAPFGPYPLAAAAPSTKGGGTAAASRAEGFTADFAESEQGPTSPASGDRADGSVGPSSPFVGPSTHSDARAEIPLGEALSAAAPSAEAIADPIVDGLVAAGAQLRVAGNTQRALQNLREAEQVLPEHPRVLGEIAATYESMGLGERAGSYWQRVLELGRAAAGGYYGIAEARVRGEPILAPGNGADDIEGGMVPLLKIGEVAVEEGETGPEGQTVALRIVIDGDQARAPQGENLALVVFFYDLVDEVRIEASTADTSEDYPSAPYDWMEDGTEEIVVTYHQPSFTPEEQRELGQRRYYGYVIELYYDEELLDKVIMPEELAAIAPETGSSSSPGPENALFPPGM